MALCYIVGMPRSGSHRAYNVARLMLQQARRKVVTMTDLQQAPRTMALADAVGDQNTWYLLHTHAPPIRLVELFRDADHMPVPVPTVYTYRHPLDVAASLRWFYGQGHDILPAMREAHRTWQDVQRVRSLNREQIIMWEYLDLMAPWRLSTRLGISGVDNILLPVCEAEALLWKRPKRPEGASNFDISQAGEHGDPSARDQESRLFAHHARPEEVRALGINVLTQAEIETVRTLFKPFAGAMGYAL